MKRNEAGPLFRVALLVLGIMIGAALVYASTDAFGTPTTKTSTLTLAETQTATLTVNQTSTQTLIQASTQTTTQTLISTQTLTTATVILTQTSTVTIIRTTTSAFPLVSASVINCGRSANGTDYCAVTLTNSGTAGAGLTGCRISISGTSAIGRVTGQTTVPAGVQSTADCSAVGPAQAVGSQATGFFSLNDGSTVPYNGTWS